jgi:hypothetical protein
VAYAIFGSATQEVADTAGAGTFFDSLLQITRQA